MLKFGDWINRKRHNRGFGIQSPSAFFFITQVLKERLPYYAYDTLDSIAKECGEMKREQCRRLFRITDYHTPANAIAIASVTAACAISSARRTVPKLLLTQEGAIPECARQHLNAEGCLHMQGDTLQLLKENLKAYGTIGLLYIGKCDNQPQLVEAALEHTNKESIIIVEGIHRDKEHKEWWKKVIANHKPIATYDMYSFGILLFKDNRPKQNYTLKI